MTTYTVSTFDRNRWTKKCDGWLAVAWHVPARIAIQHVRDLEDMGYDRGVSIFVQRDDWVPQASKPKKRKVEPALTLFGESA